MGIDLFVPVRNVLTMKTCKMWVIFCVFVFTVPRKCSVVGCRGNYTSRKGEPPDVNKVSVFRFPKDECKKQEWLRRIPQELVADDINDSMVMCEKHFEERFIIREQTFSHSRVHEMFQCWILRLYRRSSPTPRPTCLLHCPWRERHRKTGERK